MKNFDETDPLAARIQRERDALDRDMPRADLWEDISARLEAGGQAQQPAQPTGLPAQPTATGQLGQGQPAGPVQPVSPAQPTATGQPGPGQRSRIRTLLPVLRVAAVLVALSAVGLWLTRMDRQAGQPATAVVLDEDISPANDPMLTDPRFSELRKMESEYARLEQSKADLILDNPDLSPEDAQQAIDLIDDLENDYRQLRQELEAGADAEKVLEAMVRNYRQRIEVLQRMSELFKPTPPTQNQEEYASSIVL